MCCLIHVFLSSVAINPPASPPTHTHTHSLPLFSILPSSQPPTFSTFPAELGIGEMPRKQNQVRRGVGVRWGGMVRGRGGRALSLTMIGRRLCSLWEAWQRLLVLSPRVHRWFTSSPRNSFSTTGKRRNREVGRGGGKGEAEGGVRFGEKEREGKKGGKKESCHMKSTASAPMDGAAIWIKERRGGWGCYFQGRSGHSSMLQTLLY